MASFIVLLGAPGAGKGTQARRVSQRLNLPHISSGDLFRAHERRKTALGEQAQRYLAAGDLVPDSVTIAMIRERLAQPDCRSGAVLDGFPRTVPQAEALDRLLADLRADMRQVILIRVDEDRLVERLAGRRVCEAHGHVYHMIYNPPRSPEVCDQDGSPLRQRSDDQPETVRTRIQVYEQRTRPLVDYYRTQGVLREVNGDQDIDGVTEEILQVLETGVTP